MSPRLSEWLGSCYHWLMLELRFPHSASSLILPLVTSDLAQVVNKLSQTDQLSYPLHKPICFEEGMYLHCHIAGDVSDKRSRSEGAGSVSRQVKHADLN